MPFWHLIPPWPSWPLCRGAWSEHQVLNSAGLPGCNPGSAAPFIRLEAVWTKRGQGRRGGYCKNTTRENTQTPAGPWAFKNSRPPAEPTNQQGAVVPDVGALCALSSACTVNLQKKTQGSAGNRTWVSCTLSDYSATRPLSARHHRKRFDCIHWKVSKFRPHQPKRECASDQAVRHFVDASGASDVCILRM